MERKEDEFQQKKKQDRDKLEKLNEAKTNQLKEFEERISQLCTQQDHAQKKLK